MANAFWDKVKMVREITKATTSKLVVEKVEKNGKEYFSIREWYCTKNDPTWKPAKNGMTIPKELAMLVVEAIAKELVVNE